MAKYTPPPVLKQQYFFGQGLKLVQTGRKEAYFALLEDLGNELPQNAELLKCVGNYLYYVWAEELEAFEKYSEECLQQFIVPIYGKEFAYIDKAARAEMNKDYATAIENYRAYIDSTGQGGIRMAAVLASVHRKNGDFEKALEQIDETLKLDPHQPATLIEKSKILDGLGKRDEALQVYEKAMDIWKDADDFFKLYKDALEFGQELNGGS